MKLPSNRTERHVRRQLLFYASLFAGGYLSVVAYQAAFSDPDTGAASAITLPAANARMMSGATNAPQMQYTTVREPGAPASAVEPTKEGETPGLPEDASINNYPDISPDPDMQIVEARQRDEYFQSTSYALAHDTDAGNRLRLANQLREMLTAPDPDPRLNQLLESLAGDANQEVAAAARDGLHRLAARRR